MFPAELEYEQWRASHDPHAHPPVLERLKASAKKRDLWNLFQPAISGLPNLDYAAVAEISGWSPVIAPEAINCQAPDTGNMETLHLFATPEQKEQWLEPLLSGEIRSAFAMTEPDVASSDATNITTRMVRDGDDYVINGRKWWISGAADPRCQVFIVMGKTDPAAETYRQQSMILVPRDAPGMTIERQLPIFGYQDQHGHSVSDDTPLAYFYAWARSLRIVDGPERRPPPLDRPRRAQARTPVRRLTRTVGGQLAGRCLVRGCPGAGICAGGRKGGPYRDPAMGTDQKKRASTAGEPVARFRSPT